MGKPKRQKNTAVRDQEMQGQSAVRITHLDSTEQIEQFYQGLSPVEQEAMRQDAARWIEEYGEAPQYPQGTRFVEKALLDRLIEDFMRNLDFQGKAPEVGDRFSATSVDGYTVNAVVVPTQMPEHPIKGIPLAMQANVFDSKGHYLVAKEDMAKLPKEGQVLHDYYIHPGNLGAMAYVYQDPEEGTEFFLHEGDFLLFYPHWYRGSTDGSLRYVGKSSLEQKEEALPDDGDLRLDLETLLGMPLDQRLHSSGLILAMTHLSEYKESAFGPDDYVRLIRHLYRVNEHGILEHLGKHEGTTTRELMEVFEQLAGKLVGTIHIAEDDVEFEDNQKEKQHIILPDEGLEVQVHGFTHGMDILSLPVFDAVQPDEPFPDDLFAEGILTGCPIDPREIEKHGREAASNVLLGETGLFTTNAPELFCEQYAKGFAKGYQFGLYATPRGLLQLLHSIRSVSKFARYELSHRFAWELIMQEPSPNKDALMTSKLDQLKAMYEEYQAAS